MVQKELTDNEGGLSEEKNYDPKYDPISKILIGFGPVLLFGLWVYFTFVNLKIEVSLSLILSLCITILFLWCIMPQNYFLGDGKLVIQAGWPVSFSFGFDSVLDVRPISIGEVNPQCKCRMKFATALDDVVLIEREGCDLLISPEDSEEFVNNMKRMVREYNGLSENM